jgi:hypothetical protein
LLNWYYQIENYLEVGKAMAQVKAIFVKRLPIAIGTDEQIKSVETAVSKLLEICQSKYDKKYSFIHYIQKTYEPKKITEKLEDFELLSYKEFTDELGKQKVKLTATQKMELLELYENTIEAVKDIDRQIELEINTLDKVVLDIYKIPKETAVKIMS